MHQNLVNIDDVKLLKQRFYNQLDERNKRLYAGIEAECLGHYGVSQISTLLNIHPHTVRRGKCELLTMPTSPPSCIRKTGSGRKKK